MNAPTAETPRAVAERLATALSLPRHLLQELHDLHARQWRLEDESRRPDASPHQVAEAKRSIDACNLRRHRLIDAIDESVAGAEDRSDDRYYSETAGELCDRLLILDLKRQRLAGSDTRPEPDGAVSRASRADLSSVDMICQHLAAVVTRLIEDVTAGRAVLPPRVGIKVYNGAVA